MSFANLKRNRADISKLVQAAEAAGGSGEKKSYVDDRFWKPTRDKSGNGYAVIRFLPAPEGEDLPGFVIGIMGSRDRQVYGILRT